MNAQQLEAFRAITERRESVFVSGAGGTGKSYLVQKIREWAKSRGVPIAVTATTGSAALLIGGRTLHSALCMGIGRDPPEKVYESIRKFHQVRAILQWKMLIIDEISMLSAETLELVSRVLSLVRKNSAVFGGLQRVFIGDFLQIAPVEGRYAFESEIWSAAAPRTIELVECVRQQQDPAFQSILDSIRRGECNEEQYYTLAACHKHRFVGSDIRPTILYSTRRNVAEINSREYAALLASGVAERAFPTVYEGRNPEASKRWATAGGVPESLSLCIGAQVVVTMNMSMDSGVINGTRGVVVDMYVCEHDPPRSYVKIKKMDAEEAIIPYKKRTNDQGALAIQYMPLAYAWALTIHKSQGMTLDCVSVDVGPSVFACGQAYTALSRVRTLETLHVRALDPRAFKADPRVLAFYGVGAAAPNVAEDDEEPVYDSDVATVE